MEKRQKQNLTKFFKYAAILVVCSLVLGVPVTRLTLDWSKAASYRIYGTVARTLHLHSPTVVSLDKNGIPINNTGYQNGKYVGNQRNPLTIATQAISYYSQYANGNSDDVRQKFLNCISWLENAKQDKGDYYLWPYDFPLSSYNATAPWYSAMAQTRIMVAFEKAYQITGESEYLDISTQAMNALKVSIENGGVLRVDISDDGFWYEEVAGGGSGSSYILNGFIFTLLDLDQLYQDSGSTEAKLLFDAGVTELKRHIAQYDTGRWTYYDRIGHLAYDYHYVHISQMKQLYKITNDAVFNDYYRRWNSYFPFNPLWARERFAAYLLDSLLVFLLLAIATGSYQVLKYRKLHQQDH